MRRRALTRTPIRRRAAGPHLAHLKSAESCRAESSRPNRGLTYRQALDEALCFGWIDGVRRAWTRTASLSASRRGARAASGVRSTSGAAGELEAGPAAQQPGLAAFRGRRPPRPATPSNPAKRSCCRQRSTGRSPPTRGRARRSPRRRPGARPDSGVLGHEREEDRDPRQTVRDTVAEHPAPASRSRRSARPAKDSIPDAHVDLCRKLIGARVRPSVHAQPAVRAPHALQVAVRDPRRDRLAGARHRRQRGDLLAVQPDAAAAAAGAGARAAGQPRRRPGRSPARSPAAKPATATRSSATRCSATSSACSRRSPASRAHRVFSANVAYRRPDDERRRACWCRAATSRCSACSRRSAGCSRRTTTRSSASHSVAVLGYATGRTASLRTRRPQPHA